MNGALHVTGCGMLRDGRCHCAKPRPCLCGHCACGHLIVDGEPRQCVQARGQEPCPCREYRTNPAAE